MTKPKKPKRWVISHFPHPTGWRFSWIENGERHESESFSKPGEARRAAKHKQKEFDAEDNE